MNTEEKLIAKFIQNHTTDVALKLEELQVKDITTLLESLPVELSAVLLSQMDRFISGRCIEKMDLGLAIQIVEKAPFPAAEMLLRQIDPELSKSILAGLPRKISNRLQQIFKYPKNSVSAFLDPDVFTLFEDDSILQGLEKIKKNNPPISGHIFILDRNQTLIGSIELKQLITNESNKQIRSLAKRDLPKVLPDVRISELKDVWKRNGLYSQLPVVDSAGIFLGVIAKESMSKIRKKKSMFDHHASQTSSALGELYNIGLSSLFQSASTIIGNQNLK